MPTGLDEALVKVRSYVETTFAGKFEIYDIRFKSSNKRLTLEVQIDGPEGIKVEDCETVSRSLSRFLDENEHLIPGSYSLDVSSPGAERILKREVDFERNVGRLVRWIIKPTKAAPKEVFQGRLHEFSPERVVVIVENSLREFPLTSVEEARAVLEFPRKARG